MFRAIVGAVARRFAGRVNPVSKESSAVLPGPEINGISTPENGIIPARDRTALAGEALSSALSTNGKPARTPIAHQSNDISEAEIRLRAYLKWEAAGKPKGHESRFWLEAKEELLNGE